AVLAVPVLLVVALVSISGLKRRVADLETEVAQLRWRPASDAIRTAPAEPTLDDWMRQAPPPPRTPPSPPVAPSAPVPVEPVAPAPAAAPVSAPPPPSARPASADAPPPRPLPPR